MSPTDPNEWKPWPERLDTSFARIGPSGDVEAPLPYFNVGRRASPPAHAVSRAAWDRWRARAHPLLIPCAARSLSRLSRVSIGRARPAEGWATAGKPQRCGVCEVTLAGEGVQVLASRWRGMLLSLDCDRVAAVGGASEGEGGRTEVAPISHSKATDCDNSLFPASRVSEGSANRGRICQRRPHQEAIPVATTVPTRPLTT